MVVSSTSLYCPNQPCLSNSLMLYVAWKVSWQYSGVCPRGSGALICWNVAESALPLMLILWPRNGFVQSRTTSPSLLEHLDSETNGPMPNRRMDVAGPKSQFLVEVGERYAIMKDCRNEVSAPPAMAKEPFAAGVEKP